MKKKSISRIQKTPVQTVAIALDRYLRVFVCDVVRPSLIAIVHLCGFAVKLGRWALLAALAVCALPFAVATVLCAVVCAVLAVPFVVIVK